MVEAKELVQSGSLKSAEQIYLQLAAKDPGNAKIYSNLGTIYLQLKNYGDARDAFLEALRIDDTVALRHYNLGLAYIGLKTNEKAKVSLKKAIQLSPGKTKYVETLEKIK
jgi:tetratricopeptide (TPR) repeat protein